MNSLLRLVLFLTACTAGVVQIVKTQTLTSGMFDTVPRLIRAAGYPVEKHRANTADGYVLQMHRIPAGRWSAGRGNPKERRPVLIVHGLMGCSDNFLLMGPNRSLGYMLANAGYDVWLGNLRGTSYSTHKVLQKNDPKFWDFSFHEQGGFDLPAMIDYIVNATRISKLMYVGHSMGTTSFFTMLSQRPEYNDKIVGSVALGPAVYMDHLKGLVKLLLGTYNITNRLRSEGIYYLTMSRDVVDFLVNRVCVAKTPEDDICMRVMYSVAGEDYAQNDWNVSPMLPARVQPSSLGTLEHYSKIALSGIFTTLDGGLNGPIVPYNLSNVKVPILLLYGENDQITTKSNVMRLAHELNATGALEDVRPASRWPKFNHMDFVFAKDLGRLVNRPLIADMARMYEKYAPGLV